MTGITRKCPKCGWRGSWKMFMKHYKKHFTPKKAVAKRSGGTWKTPPYARRK